MARVTDLSEKQGAERTIAELREAAEALSGAINRAVQTFRQTYGVEPEVSWDTEWTKDGEPRRTYRMGVKL